MPTRKFLLTDVLPYEIPLIFSNSPLYNHIKDNSIWFETEFEKLQILDTEPYNYKIQKNRDELRNISLIHPLGQLQMTKFFERYSEDLIDFFETNRVFSVRYPYSIKKSSELSEEVFNKMMDVFNVNINFTDIDSESKNGKTHFRIKDYKKITDFYRSELFKTLEVKYGVLKKIDVKSCFDSIYTHALEWSFLGSKYLAKDYVRKDRKLSRDDINRFSKNIDRIMQSVNYAETNGIVVGPEFSRCISEIILCRIDKLVYQDITELNLVHKDDYEVIRFMDDIFIFSNDETICKSISDSYQQNCINYKLSLNEKKSFVEKKPFLRKHLWVTPLKDILNHQKLELNELIATQNDDLTYNDISRIIVRFYDDTINRFKNLITEYEEQGSYICSYIMAVAEKSAQEMITKINEIDKVKIKVLFFKKYYSFVQYILSFSLTSTNVIKYCKLAKIMVNNLNADNQNMLIVNDYVFSKTVELIQYNSTNPNEILNLIILLKSFKRNINDSIFYGILENDSSYFTLSTICYYVNDAKRLRYYSKLIRNINNIVRTKINKINSRFNLSYSKNKKDDELRQVLLSKDFYFINDFKKLSIINKANRDELCKIIDSVNISHYAKDKEVLLKSFLDFTLNSKATFMNWNAIEEEVLFNIATRANDKVSYT